MLLGIIEEKHLPPDKNEDCKPPDKLENKKRQVNVHDTDMISRHLADSFEADLKQDEKLMTADNITLAVDKKYYE